MVEPRGDDFIESLRVDQLSVHSVDPPKRDHDELEINNYKSGKMFLRELSLKGCPLVKIFQP